MIICPLLGELRVDITFLEVLTIYFPKFPRSSILQPIDIKVLKHQSNNKHGAGELYLVQQRAQDVRLCVGSVLGTQEAPTQTLQ